MNNLINELKQQVESLDPNLASQVGIRAFEADMSSIEGLLASLRRSIKPVKAHIFALKRND
jgi:hypothetical protein